MVDLTSEVVYGCVGDICSHFLFRHSLPPAAVLYKVTALLKTGYLGYHVLYGRKQGGVVVFSQKSDPGNLSQAC